MKTYPLNRIIEITHDIVRYCDDDGTEKEFPLKECNANWISYMRENLHSFMKFDGSPLDDNFANESVCVAERDWFAEHPYFEFYASERIRFEIVPKRRLWDYLFRYWRQRYHKEFYAVQRRLNAVGWSSFDLG